MIKFIRNLFNDDKLLKENPFFSLLIFAPAGLISSFLSIPFMVLSFPILIFNQQTQFILMRFLLYIQHSMSLGGLYVIEEIIFKDFQFYDIIIGSCFALISFRKSIKSMVEETLIKTFK